MNYVIYYCLTTSTGITKNMKKIIVLIVCSISFISCSPEKKSERTFLGKKREGKTIAMEINKTVYSKIDIYTLQLTKQKKTCMFVFQSGNQDINAEKAFAAIAKSLKEVVVE